MAVLARFGIRFRRCRATTKLGIAAPMSITTIQAHALVAHRMEVVMSRTSRMLSAVLIGTCCCVAIAADTFWEVRCNSESGNVIGAFATNAEAVQFASGHVVRTGHTTTTQERPNPKK